MEQAKTIHEAVSMVLSQEGRPCSIQEIVDTIVSKKLYTFKVNSPRSVIRQSIRRRCEGYSNLDRSGKPMFRETEGGRFTLVD